MKRFIVRFPLILLCVVLSFGSMTGKKIDLLDLLFEDDEAALEFKAPYVTLSINESKEDSADDFNETSQIDLDDSLSDQSRCSLLNLLFEDTRDVNQLFPSKHEKYYRGQFQIMGLNYIDNSVCDESVPARIKQARPIDQDEITPEEKAVVEKYYRLIKQQFESPWYMKFINKKTGYGIFAAADIEAGQLIAEYVGLIYDDSTYLSAPRNPRYCWNVQPPSQVENKQKFYIDALTSCNFTRIINHSYKPNVIPVSMHGPDGSRMLYVACEKIKKDEQLLVNYGEGYWVSRGEPEDLSR